MPFPAVYNIYTGKYSNTLITMRAIIGISAARMPAAGVATVVPLAITKLSPVVVAVPVLAVEVDCPLANTNPLLVVPVVLVLVVVDAVTRPPVDSAVVLPPCNDPIEFTVPAVMTPLIVPVQACPLGQHATYPAASALHTALGAQQSPDAPRLPQLLNKDGQAVLSCLLKTSCSCAV